MRLICTCMLLGGLVASVLAQEPLPEDQQAVLAAWEQKQSADPQTIAFERTGDRTYRLHTKRFPYDGTARVANIVIRGEPPASAVVEVTLDRPSIELREQYPASFPQWAMNNTLWRDARSGGWLNLDEYARRERRSSQQTSWWSQPQNSALVVGSIAIFLTLLAAAAAVRHQVKLARQQEADNAVRDKLLELLPQLAAGNQHVLERLDALSPVQRWRPKHARSATGPVGDTDLTASQIERLEIYFRMREFADADRFWRTQTLPWRAWILRWMAVALTLVPLWFGSVRWTLFLLGIVLGVVCTHLGYRGLFAQTWPALRRVIDWPALQRLLEGRKARSDRL